MRKTLFIISMVVMSIFCLVSCGQAAKSEGEGMDTKQLTEMFRHRRSVRQYDKTPIAEEKLNAILSLCNTDKHPAPRDANYMNWNKVHKERY